MQTKNEIIFFFKWGSFLYVSDTPVKLKEQITTVMLGHRYKIAFEWNPVRQACLLVTGFWHQHMNFILGSSAITGMFLECFSVSPPSSHALLYNNCPQAELTKLHTLERNTNTCKDAFSWEIIFLITLPCFVGATLSCLSCFYYTESCMRECFRNEL